MSSGDFDWRNDDAIVLRETPMTAVYLNGAGQVVVRQAHWPDDDQFIFFDVAFVEAIARAILETASLAEGEELPVRSDPTKAEPQRRRRKRQADRDTRGDVMVASGDNERDIARDSAPVASLFDTARTAAE